MSPLDRAIIKAEWQCALICGVTLGMMFTVWLLIATSTGSNVAAHSSVPPALVNAPVKTSPASPADAGAFQLRGALQ